MDHYFKLNHKKDVDFWRIRIFCIILFTIFPLILYGQDTTYTSRNNIKVGYSRYLTNILRDNKPTYYKNLKLEFSYRVFNQLETGVYIGVSKFNSNSINLLDTTLMSKRHPALFYGITFNYDILPLIINNNESRFEFYLTGKLGAFFLKLPNGYFPNGNNLEYAGGIGVSFYIFNNLGIFSEYTIGKYFFEDYDNFKYGLSLKF